MNAMIIVWAVVAVVGLVIFLWFFPVTLWFQALISGVRISLIQLVLMRWRGVSPNTIVMAMVTGTKAGLKLYANELEAHYLAKGNVPKVVNALISADKANISLDFKMAAAIDLAGRDVFEAVQMSVNPKVINTPPVTAVAKDGIQLIAKARVTVRANIKQLVGGAGEETVLARVGEGIVSSIGSAESHKLVLENPDSISKVVLNKGLDAGTAFEILSIDIADIDIGKNIGAVLQMDQAEADKNIAQARAEERRAMAVALEQEMKAKAQEARARVIEAEAEVPLAMAEAFRTGNLGIMDYYKMKNIQRLCLFFLFPVGNESDDSCLHHLRALALSVRMVEIRIVEQAGVVVKRQQSRIETRVGLPCFGIARKLDLNGIVPFSARGIARGTEIESWSAVGCNRCTAAKREKLGHHAHLIKPLRLAPGLAIVGGIGDIGGHIAARSHNHREIAVGKHGHHRFAEALGFHGLTGVVVVCALIGIIVHIHLREEIPGQAVVVRAEHKAAEDMAVLLRLTGLGIAAATVDADKERIVLLDHRAVLQSEQLGEGGNVSLVPVLKHVHRTVLPVDLSLHRLTLTRFGIDLAHGHVGGKLLDPFHRVKIAEVSVVVVGGNALIALLGVFSEPIHLIAASAADAREIEAVLHRNVRDRQCALRCGRGPGLAAVVGYRVARSVERYVVDDLVVMHAPGGVDAAIRSVQHQWELIGAPADFLIGISRIHHEIRLTNDHFPFFHRFFSFLYTTGKTCPVLFSELYHSFSLSSTVFLPFRRFLQKRRSRLDK